MPAHTAVILGSSGSGGNGRRSWATLIAKGKSHALGLVSWFRSSPHYDIDLLANFETKTTLGINTLLVSFRFRNSPKGDIEMLRISESGHLCVLC